MKQTITLLQTASWKWKLAQSLEYKWWQNYLQNRDAGVYLQWKYTYWKDLLDSLSSYLPSPFNKTILDAGCGPAGIFIALDGNAVDALDPLLEKYKALPHFEPARYPWTTFMNAPIELLDEDQKYDVVFCMNAINHVKDLDKCYDNLVRALKPGGYMIISTDAHRHATLKKIFQLIPGDVLHPVQLDIEEYDEKLTGRGLQILHNKLFKREKIFDYYITIAKK